jgi:hypothetical protein
MTTMTTKAMLLIVGISLRKEGDYYKEEREE